MHLDSISFCVIRLKHTEWKLLSKELKNYIEKNGFKISSADYIPCMNRFDDIFVLKSIDFYDDPYDYYKIEVEK